MDKKEKEKCKKGERRNPKTGLCEKMSEDLLKHKQSLRNKKKGVVTDVQGNIVRPTRYSKKNRPVLPEVGTDLPESLIDVSIQNPELVIDMGVIATEEDAQVEVAAIELEPNVEDVDEDEDEDEDEDKGIELYPTLDDPDFSYKIAQRQEFADTKYDGEIKDIREQAKRLCNTPFELLPHQLFVRNFLSFQTPYNSLLLYHGLGSGKTCSAIGIAEEMRSYMKQMGITKRIIIVASPNVQDNFRLQLFDERKLEQLPDGTWNLNTCIGNALLQEINPTNLQGLTKERIISQIRSLINQFYVFMGNKGEFANYITKALAIPADSGYSEKELTALREKKIRAHFNNRLVVLDEIHNIRISDANKTKLTSVLLNEIARKSDNMRLLLLSATPMYNSFNEIIWLANILNANDNRGSIKIEDVFNPDGSFIDNGRELLIRKLTGYISYVRGENPYVFPYRIYPNTFAPDRLIGEYPTKQMNQMEIQEPIRYIPIYKNGIGSYQSKGYEFILQDLGLKSTIITDKNGKERAMPSFENMEHFGYTLLLVPLESLIMVYPNAKLDKILESKKSYTDKEAKDVIASMIGKQGLSNIMKYTRVEKPIPKRFNYEYRKSSYGHIFAPEEIGKYSSKISNICDILRKPSKGIVLIYSQYIDGGLIPMALALESMGFSRYASTPEHSKNLLKSGLGGEPIDSDTMKKRSEKGHQARYVLITGDKDFSQNNNNDLKYITSKENAQGSQVKVILISMAASEGLDFKNIRQIHILEPWYNMNRIEQIIGRGVRNFSHCDVEFEDRNVEIYLHGTVLDRDEGSEAADLYVYRSAEKKAIQIGRVTRVLKEIAVDCLLNVGQTNFTEAKLLEEVANRDIRIRLSSRGDELIPFKIGDKPRTEACDYMESCEYSCAVRAGLPEITDPIKDTYDENFVKANSVVIMKKIRDLYREKVIYSREHLIGAINQLKKYPIEHIYYALTRFIQNKNEGLIDKYGRSGYLISRGNMYAFQPNEIMDESISIFERSTPVDYKPVSLIMEVPKEIKEWKTGTMETTGTTGTTGTTETMETTENREQIEQTKSYEDLVGQIGEIMKILENKDLVVKAIHKDWYKHASKVVEELISVHGMKMGVIQKFVIFHFLDKLYVKNKLVLVKQIYENLELNGFEDVLKEYFDRLLLKTDEDGEMKEAIVLADGDVNKLFVKEKGEWILGTYTDEKMFSVVKKDRLMIPYEKINRTEIGFMHPFKEKEVVFKMKDLTQKRNNTGAKCVDASKPSIASKIGAVLQTPSIYTATQIEKPELCILLEIIMRWKTEARGIYYFFGPEHVNEMKISTLHW